MVKRKMLAADEWLAEQMVKIAEEKGQTLYSLVNEALDQTLKANQMKTNLKQIVDFYTIMEIHRASGHILIPRDTLNELIKKQYLKEAETLRQTWLNAGKWFGKFLAAKLPHETVEFFVKMLKTSEWQLDDVTFEEKEDTIRLTLSSFTLPKENTELLMNYVQGVMESLGYQTEKTELMKGMISLHFKRKYPLEKL